MAQLTPVDPFQLGTDDLYMIAGAANLPPRGTVLLILGDRHLDSAFQAITIAREHVRSAATLYGLQDWLGRPWDCGISIQPEWARRHHELPAYFAYLVGHELGHATTILSDLELSSFEELVVASRNLVSGAAGLSWGEFPHERRYDQFGLAVAEAMHGRSRVHADINAIIDAGLSRDVPRLKRVLSMNPRLDLRGLRDELAAFCARDRGPLVEAWAKKKASAAPGVTRNISRPESLWEPRTA